MAGKNYYDVTEWPVGNPYEDIGEVINSIIADVKSRQADADKNALSTLKRQNITVCCFHLCLLLALFIIFNSFIAYQFFFNNYFWVY